MFKKWDIVFATKFPDTIECGGCKRHFSITKHKCTYCDKENSVSNIVAKPRPVIVWIDNDKWYESMAFGIPLSKTCYKIDRCNHMVLLDHYLFKHPDQKYHIPMRAMVHQSTRIDGNVLSEAKIIGTITDVILQNEIENKMVDWLFG